MLMSAYLPSPYSNRRNTDSWWREKCLVGHKVIMLMLQPMFILQRRLIEITGEISYYNNQCLYKHYYQYPHSLTDWLIDLCTFNVGHAFQEQFQELLVLISLLLSVSSSGGPQHVPQVDGMHRCTGTLVQLHTHTRTQVGVKLHYGCLYPLNCYIFQPSRRSVQMTSIHQCC